MSYPPPPEPFPPSQPFPPPADPMFHQGPSGESTPPGQPGYGPPVSGQPGAGQPAPPVFQPGMASPNYQQPGHPPPGYQQHGYQQAGYPQAPFPAYSPQPTPPGGRGGSGALLWVLIAVFAVLLCGGALTAGVIAYRNSGNQDGNNTTDAGPTPQPPSLDPGLPGPTGQPDPDPTETPDDPGTADPSDRAGGGLVTYEVTGDGPASVQYLRGPAAIESLTNQRLPWRLQVRVEQTAFVSLMASREGNKTGKITCRVRVDGKEVAKQTAQGTFAIVTCLNFDFD